MTIEFAFDSFMRIRHWKFIVKETIEYLPKNTLSDCKNDDSKLEEATKNVMEHGQPPKSMHYLRVRIHQNTVFIKHIRNVTPSQFYLVDLIFIYNFFARSELC